MLECQLTEGIENDNKLNFLSRSDKIGSRYPNRPEAPALIIMNTCCSEV
jgi:hypothetical protein